MASSRSREHIRSAVPGEPRDERLHPAGRSLNSRKSQNVNTASPSVYRKGYARGRTVPKAREFPVFGRRTQIDGSNRERPSSAVRTARKSCESSLVGRRCRSRSAPAARHRGSRSKPLAAPPVPFGCPRGGGFTPAEKPVGRFSLKKACNTSRAFTPLDWRITGLRMPLPPLIGGSVFCKTSRMPLPCRYY